MCEGYGPEGAGVEYEEEEEPDDDGSDDGYVCNV